MGGDVERPEGWLAEGEAGCSETAEPLIWRKPVIRAETGEQGPGDQTGCNELEPGRSPLLVLNVTAQSRPEELGGRPLLEETLGHGRPAAWPADLQPHTALPFFPVVDRTDSPALAGSASTSGECGQEWPAVLGGGVEPGATRVLIT